MALTREELELLARLDERSQNTLKAVEKIEKHLEAQNGKVNKLSRNFWLLVGILVGSGIISGTVFGVLEGLSG